MLRRPLRQPIFTGRRPLPVYRFGSVEPPPSAAPEFFGYATSVADNSSAAGPTCSVTPPSSMAEGDFALVLVSRRDNSWPLAPELSITSQGGQRWSSWAATDSGGSGTPANIQGMAFWCQFNGTWSGNPAWRTTNGYNGDSSSTLGMTAVMIVFRPSSPDKFFVPMILPRDNVYTSSGTTKTINGGTTVTQHGSNKHVAIAAWFTPAANTWGSLAGTGWTKSGLPAHIRNLEGSDLSCSFAYHLSTASGSIPNVSQDQDTGTAGAGMFMVFTEITLPAGGTGGSRAFVQSEMVGDNDGLDPHTTTLGAAVGSGNSIVGAWMGESFDSFGANVAPIFPITDNQGNQAVVVQCMHYFELGQVGFTFYIPGVTNAPTSVSVDLAAHVIATNLVLHEITGGVKLDRYGQTWGFPGMVAEWTPLTVPAFTTTAPSYIFACYWLPGQHEEPPHFDVSGWGGTKREEIGSLTPVTYNTTCSADLNQSSAGSVTVTDLSGSSIATGIMVMALKSA
jgi:hypothetical protein